MPAVDLTKAAGPIARVQGTPSHGAEGPRLPRRLPTPPYPRRGFDDVVPGCGVEDDRDRGNPAVAQSKVLSTPLDACGQRGVQVVYKRRLSVAVQITDPVDACY